MTPSCPWCGKRTSVERLPRIVAGKEWVCSACNVVMSGTQDEHRASVDQRHLVQSIRSHREHHQQEELLPDA